MSASVNAEIDYAQLENAGKRAAETVDGFLGRRPRRTSGPQILALIGLVAVIGVLMAWLTWSRRAPWADSASYASREAGDEPDHGS
jgi:hypothetical protein